MEALQALEIGTQPFGIAGLLDQKCGELRKNRLADVVLRRQPVGNARGPGVFARHTNRDRAVGTGEFEVVQDTPLRVFDRARKILAELLVGQDLKQRNGAQPRIPIPEHILVGRARHEKRILETIARRPKHFHIIAPEILTNEIGMGFVHG